MGIDRKPRSTVLEISAILLTPVKRVVRVGVVQQHCTDPFFIIHEYP
jgi:hypothetical protein